MLLTVACGRSGAATATLTPTRTPAPTPTLAPATALVWQAHQPPVSLVAPRPNNVFLPTLAFSQSDSDTAYECAALPGASPQGVQVWITRDRAAHWSRVADIMTGGLVDACTIVVDDLDPATAAVQAIRRADSGCVPAIGCGEYHTFVTRNAGQMWTPMTGPYTILLQLATRGGATYALFSQRPQSITQTKSSLAVSRDGLRTWTSLNGAFSPIQRFWLNRFTGAVLALTDDNGLWWLPPGTGQSWEGFPNPPFPAGNGGITVQPPFADQPWHVCSTNQAGAYLNGEPNPHTEDLACTADGGATWTIRHIPALANYAALVIAIADDGSVLLEQGRSSLYRLAPGQTTLESLGPVPPSATVVYMAGTGSGVLWSLPTYYAGQVVDAQGRVFTASYA